MEPITVAEVLQELPTVLSNLVFDYYYSFQSDKNEVINELKYKFSRGADGQRWRTGPQIMLRPNLGAKYFIDCRIKYLKDGIFCHWLHDTFHYYPPCV
jgi:hypothetical protein